MGNLTSESENEAILDYLKDKVKFVHEKVLSSYIYDVKGNEYEEIACERSMQNLFSHIKRDSVEFDAFDDITKKLITSILIVLLYRGCSASGNCLAFRSALMNEILFCENNKILKNLSLGYVLFVLDEDVNHTVLALVDADTEVLRYIVDPSFQKIAPMSERSSMMAFGRRALLEFRDKMVNAGLCEAQKYPDIDVHDIKFKQGVYCRLPFALSDQRRKII